MLKINEIFFSIQGESTYSGLPTVFVRTSGCHLRCHYCDTTYAYHEGHRVSVEDIIAKVEQYPTKYVCLTGGEPLLQKRIYELIDGLLEKDFILSMETSGDINCADVDPRVKKIIDVKTPDSGAADKFHENNLKFKDDGHTEYKFVICSERDLEWAFEFVKRHDLAKKNPVLFSPSHGKIAPEWLAQKILSNNAKVRLQLQLHKYIWSEHKRGV
ncbi:MAG: 7-carboxy-7-deazaguanine synthase QueE [Bdellovibrionaceae bacterium]|nr:7-carboxy-7-deazaguanine synthase QueE [Pseudobdellovibrionaceae bacterium]